MPTQETNSHERPTVTSSHIVTLDPWRFLMIHDDTWWYYSPEQRLEPKYTKMVLERMLEKHCQQQIKQMTQEFRDISGLMNHIESQRACLIGGWNLLRVPSRFLQCGHLPPAAKWHRVSWNHGRTWKNTTLQCIEKIGTSRSSAAKDLQPERTSESTELGWNRDQIPVDV